MTIKELKERRDALWADLDNLLEQFKPQETAIRNEIREIQRELYTLEMTPVKAALEAKISAGNGTEKDKAKLAILEGAL